MLGAHWPRRQRAERLSAKDSLGRERDPRPLDGQPAIRPAGPRRQGEGPVVGLLCADPSHTRKPHGCGAAWTRGSGAGPPAPLACLQATALPCHAHGLRADPQGLLLTPLPLHFLFPLEVSRPSRTLLLSLCVSVSASLCSRSLSLPVCLSFHLSPSVSHTQIHNTILLENFPASEPLPQMPGGLALSPQGPRNSQLRALGCLGPCRAGTAHWHIRVAPARSTSCQDGRIGIGSLPPWGDRE